jgi:predicted dehydrogenase
MADNQKIGFAVIGYGGMGRYHARHAVRDQGERLDVLGAFDIREARHEVAREDGFNTYESREALLSDPAVELVTVATPNDVHKEIVIDALRHGKNVICEKPVTMTTPDLEDMIAVANETGKFFTVHQNRRWDPDYLAFLKVRDEGTIGNIFKIESRVSGANGVPDNCLKFKEKGGGMVLDWGVHLIDQICDAYKDKITQVYAKVQRITTQEVDDGFMAIMTFETGMVAIVEVATSTYIKYPRWHVSGLYGSLQIDEWDLTGKIVREIAKQGHDELVPIQAGVGLTKTMAPRSAASIEELPVPKFEKAWEEYYKNIVAHLNHGEPFIVKHDEVMRVMKIMEAIFQSEAENRAIDVCL